jgi:hypothetical protein
MADVFISIPTPKSDTQQAIKRSILGIVRSLGFSPRTVGSSDEDSDFPSGPPFAHVIRVMKECSGVLVVAYEKNSAEGFTTNSASSTPTRHAQATLATPWNHAEAGIAYSLDLPTLVLCQKELFREGVLENNVIGYVQDFVAEDLMPLRPALSGRINNWAEGVRKYQPNSVSRTLDTVSFGEVVRFVAASNWMSIAQVVAAVGFVFSMGFAAGRFWPG